MPLPGLTSSGGGLIEFMAFTQTSGFLACRCQAAGFTVLRREDELA